MIATANKHKRAFSEGRGESIMKDYAMAVAGTGYVGLSIATLLFQNHTVYAVGIVPEKVGLINTGSPQFRMNRSKNI